MKKILSICALSVLLSFIPGNNEQAKAPAQRYYTVRIPEKYVTMFVRAIQGDRNYLNSISVNDFDQLNQIVGDTVGLQFNAFRQADSVQHVKDSLNGLIKKDSTKKN